VLPLWRASDSLEVCHFGVQNPLSLQLPQKVVNLDAVIVGKQRMRVENFHGVTLKPFGDLAVGAIFESLFGSNVDQLQDRLSITIFKIYL
jgi:hypothetical protein